MLKNISQPMQDFRDTFHLELPIIQAPMAGGATTAELIAAVSNAGGLGSLGAGYLSPLQLRESIGRIKALTTKPFAVNVFTPSNVDKKTNQKKFPQIAAIIQRYQQALGIQEEIIFPDYIDYFSEQIAIIIEEKIPIFSFTFGIPNANIMQQLKNNNIKIIGTATTVNEAIALENAGCDAVVAQGHEAGGHRGTFIKTTNEAMIGTMVLVPSLLKKIKIPVIAAGGIMDGRGLIAAMALGASAVQMGTAFLTCKESGIHPRYKEAIFTSSEESTVITKAYSGKSVRAIHNQFIAEMETYQNDVLDYPLQNILTQTLRKAAVQQDNIDFMSMWAGQGTNSNKNLTANELMNEIVEEANHVLNLLCHHRI